VQRAPALCGVWGFVLLTVTMKIHRCVILLLLTFTCSCVRPRWNILVFVSVPKQFSLITKHFRTAWTKTAAKTCLGKIQRIGLQLTFVGVDHIHQQAKALHLWCQINIYCSYVWSISMHFSSMVGATNYFLKLFCWCMYWTGFWNFVPSSKNVLNWVLIIWMY